MAHEHQEDDHPTFDHTGPVFERAVRALEEIALQLYDIKIRMKKPK